MSSVFEFLKRKLDGHATRQTVLELKKGQKYEVIEFKQEPSKFLDGKTNSYPLNLIAHYKSNQVKHNIILPKLYDNIEKDYVEQLNNCIKNNKLPSFVYYGKQGSANDIRILEHGEDVDHQLLQSYLKTEESNDAPPPKKLKKDSPSSSVTSDVSLDTSSSSH